MANELEAKAAPVDDKLVDQLKEVLRALYAQSSARVFVAILPRTEKDTVRTVAEGFCVEHYACALMGASMLMDASADFVRAYQDAVWKQQDASDEPDTEP